MIVDAGGGTVDLSTYTFTTISPMSVEEVVAPDCMYLDAAHPPELALSTDQASCRDPLL